MSEFASLALDELRALRDKLQEQRDVLMWLEARAKQSGDREAAAKVAEVLDAG